MSFRAANGVIEIRAPAGAIRFHSDEQLFQATNYFKGRFVTPYRKAYWNIDQGHIQPLHVDTNHVLKACHASADTVMGSFFAKTAGGLRFGAVDIGWFTVGGTYMHYHGTVGPPGNTHNYYRQNVAAYTFFCKNGTLHLNERVRITPPEVGTSTTFELALHIFDYRIYCGSFI